MGQGRLGHALTHALRRADATALRGAEPTRRAEPTTLRRAEPTRAGLRYDLIGPLGRGADGRDADAVLLCVPDYEIAPAAALIAPGRLVGHCSGATGLDALSPHEAFSLHPLMTVTDRAPSFAGAGAAIAGTTGRALTLAEELAGMLGMRPVRVPEEDRALYHAAASMASNFLVTLEAAAERLAASTGVERDLLAPLVRATVENWVAIGAERALTGPVARGDEDTVNCQRQAVQERAPDLLPLFDALIRATRELAKRSTPPPRVPAPEPQPA